MHSSTIHLAFKYGAEKHTTQSASFLNSQAKAIAGSKVMLIHCSNASFDPGGWLSEPTPTSSPLLDLAIRPRMNLYLSSESKASFVVDASISHIHGMAYYNVTDDPGYNSTSPFTTLYIDIIVAETGQALVSGGNVTVNSTANEIGFSLESLEASFNPYTIAIRGSSPDGNQTYHAETQLYKLPDRNDTRSVVRIDSLYGGLMTLQPDSSTWTPILPYSYYVSWDGWLEKSIDNVNSFKDQGYNIIHIVPNAGLPNAAFNFPELNQFLDRMDEVGLWVMFDMRWTYLNLTSVEYQVNNLKNRKSMLLWYTGDEPDGSGDPLNATKQAYDMIKALDPYHPVSLCLNCYNFHFQEYSSGADILLSDVYPIGNNVSFSLPWGTVCNTTYGDCGCDDCRGSFEDISERLDLFAQYQSWLGGPPKTAWGVPQAFGNESYWTRYPTADEEVLMAMLSINHNAKGIVAWDYPSAPDLESITSSLSKILTTAEITNFILGGPTTPLSVTGVPRVDAAAWKVGNQMLVSIVFLEYDDTSSTANVALPATASGIASTPWGQNGWTVSGPSLSKTGLAALEVDILVLDLN